MCARLFARVKYMHAHGRNGVRYAPVTQLSYESVFFFLVTLHFRNKKSSVATCYNVVFSYVLDGIRFWLWSKYI